MRYQIGSININTLVSKKIPLQLSIACSLMFLKKQALLEGL